MLDFIILHLRKKKLLKLVAKSNKFNLVTKVMVSSGSFQIPEIEHFAKSTNGIVIDLS